MMRFSIFILITYILNASACPSQEDLYPCTCFWPEGQSVAFITCSKLENNHDFVNAVRPLNGKNYVHSISIQNSVFTYIPSDGLKGLKFAELEIKNSTLMALTDTNFAFEGLEDSLEVLKLDNCQILGEWSWSILSKLKKLKSLEIKNGPRQNIEDLSEINLDNLKTVDFSHNMINFIDDRAFVGAKTLRNIILRNNEISVLKRSMFPNPAKALAVLNLSYNKIEQLPNDIFSLMPFLKSLDLGQNKILVLSENVLKPVWNALIEFKALGNELRCDCRMSWILQTKKPQIIQATCAMPQSLRGKRLATLSSDDLWCIY